jgi:tetratricopeptide (TPR) repeat protein
VASAGTGAEPQAVRRLAELCDHLPIALRIAAVRLTTRPDRTVADLAHELSDEHARLSALATDDADVSVTAALGLTCRVLPDAANQLFSLLGVHPGNSFDVRTAGALLGADPAVARRCLAALAGAHLIQQTAPDRFTRHDLIRLYSRDLVARGPAEERRTAEGRLLDYYLHVTAEAHRGGPGAVLFQGHPPFGAAPRELPAFADTAGRTAWFRAEEPVIRALVTSTDLTEHAWRLADNSWMFYNRLASDAIQMACMSAGLAAARAAGSREGTLQMLIRMASAHTAGAHFDLAFEALREGEALLDDAAPADRCRFLIQYAKCHNRAGNWNEAMRHYRDALAVARRIGQPEHEAGLLNEIAGNLALRLDPEAALLYSAEAVGRLTDLPPGMLHDVVLHTHAAILEKLGRLDEALVAYQDALASALDHGHARNAAILQHAIGTVLSDLGRTPEAVVSWERAMETYHALGMPQEQAVRMSLRAVAEKAASADSER